MKHPIHLLRNACGATAIEYALIAGAISLLIVAGVALIGTDLGNFFNNANNGL